ncbi:hypothetical protein T484DRAFT_1800652 [Baffinella frigidus]|nr:hypothetical protein T484DRAFT_1800652 [Cryptophyta sp. CCMP2293]
MGVKDFSLHRPLPVWQRLDVWPFALLHLLNLSSFVYFCTSDPASVDVSLGAGNSTTPVDKNISSFLGCRLHLVNHVLFPVVCVLHIVAHLGTYWSVRFKVATTMRKVRDIADATIVRVMPSKSTEKIGLCDLKSIHLGIDLGGEGGSDAVVSSGTAPSGRKDKFLAFE